jgi:hypothetical protein
MNVSSFNEGKLRFEFGAGWSVSKYDQHPFYLEHVERLKGPVTVVKTKGGGATQTFEVEMGTLAVDFLGVGPDQYAHFIEVKDFRGYRIENKKRIKSGELAHEVARKVRDSIAGCIGAARNATAPNALGSVATHLANHDRRVFVTLWLEDDLESDPRQWKQELDTIGVEIRRRLKWLTTEVLVISLSTHQTRPPALAVTNLPGAGRRPQ